MHVIIVTAQLTVPATDATVVDAVHDMLTETRAFDGCAGVEALVDLKDPARVTFIERWESKDAQRAYQAWRGADGAAGMQRFGALLAGAPSMVQAAPAPAL